jgi:hypothetical protein
MIRPEQFSNPELIANIQREGVRLWRHHSLRQVTSPRPKAPWRRRSLQNETV